MRIIAGQGNGTYLGVAMGKLLRLIALFALVLMPFGMGMLPASAAAPASHSSMDPQSGGHCGDETETGSTTAVGSHCGGSCSALPGLVRPDLAAAVLPSLQRAPCLAPALVGISPAPSTPPPRAA